MISYKSNSWWFKFNPLIRIAMPTVSEIFATMEYGPATETDKIAQAW